MHGGGEPADIPVTDCSLRKQFPGQAVDARIGLQVRMSCKGINMGKFLSSKKKVRLSFLL
jgi:hypothetical protein